MRERQLAMAIYLIDKLALRVGIEKNPGAGADMVRFESYSCCLCLHRHSRIFFCQLKFLQDQQEFVVEFDFPAKDSINYYDQVKSTYPIKTFTFLTFFLSACSGEAGFQQPSEGF